VITAGVLCLLVAGLFVAWPRRDDLEGGPWLQSRAARAFALTLLLGALLVGARRPT
jgi:hypothetical protein